MKNKRYILIVLLLVSTIFLSTITVASSLNDLQTFSTFEKYSPITLKKICNNCTYANISSVTYLKNSKQIIGQVPMTQSGTEYSYSVPIGNSTYLGRYLVNGFYDLNGVKTTWSYEYDITADGLPYSKIPLEIILIISSYAILFLTLFLKKGRMLQYLSSVLLIVLGVYTLSSGYSYIDSTTFIGFIIGFVTIATGIYYLFENSFSYQRQVKNYDPDDDGRYHDN